MVVQVPYAFSTQKHTCISYIQVDEFLRLSTWSKEQKEEGNEGEKKSQQQAQADQNHDRGDLELQKL